MAGYTERIGPGCLAVILAPVLLATFWLVSDTWRGCAYERAERNSISKTYTDSQKPSISATQPSRASEGKLIERLDGRR